MSQDAPQGSALLEQLRARLGGQYHIEGLLGQGGMGSVFRARDVTLDRAVAIKVISGDVASNPQLRERFLQEARTVAKLRHPNIVAVYSAGDAGGVLYFVMELVPGESLRDLLDREGRVEPARAERILHELALALDYAHANGIVHRDVKPENILLDRETGRAMLTDFGVARALEGDGRMTGTGMILGSPRYMSPEQATGEQTLDGRSDLYALALVGYEMFTGKPVVDAGNVAAMLVKHLTETPKPIADAVPAVPEGVATAIDRALAKDREQRWANGREMAEVIGMAWTPAGATSGIGSRTSARAAAERPGFRMPAEPRARARAWFVLGVSALSLLATLVVLFRNREGRVPRGVDPRRSYAVMPFEVQSSNREVAWLRDGAVNMLTLALSQWRDLAVADYERTMVLVREAGLEERRVDLDKALEIARRAGAWTVVTGTVTTTADSLRVDARLYDVASGRALTTETRAAPLADDPRPLFDGLARYLLGIAGAAATGGRDLSTVTTTSLVAYRAYVDGTRALFSWRLPQADSLFRVAIAADSTFALAWHKRSLALGWANAGGDAYTSSARRAAELADRLPARDQALVRGHAALSQGMQAQGDGRGDGRAQFREAQRIYRDLIASDSAVAEAWYGLADALYHDPFSVDSAEAGLRRLSESRRAFHHTLALDSTFHLAYSHLIQMYQGYGSPSSGLVLDGEEVHLLADSTVVRRLGGAARLAALRTAAQERGLDLARAWARADEGALQPLNTLVQGFLGAGLVDSAAALLDRLQDKAIVANPVGRLWVASYGMFVDSPDAAAKLLDATRGADVDVLRGMPLNDRYLAMALAMDAAGASGNGAEIARITDLWARADTIFPQGGIATRPWFEFLQLGLELAQRGTITPAERARMLPMLRRAASQPANSIFRTGTAPSAYLGYLLSRDTAFASLARQLAQQGLQTPYPELDAAIALTNGDSAEARRLAATFSPADSVRRSRLGMAGMRTALRAEVLAELGDLRGAVAQYEAIHPSRFNTALVDPGFTVYVRTFAARARLLEQLGERDRAIAAWEEFLRRWEHGDGNTEPARREARAALQRLRDQSPTGRSR